MDPFTIGISVVTIGGALLGGITSALAALRQARRSSKEVDELRNKQQANKSEMKPAWDYAQGKLIEYIDKNLAQMTFIFWASVVILAVGFTIILLGVTKAIQSPEAISPALIAAISGMITEFVGATFLLLYNSTLKQASEYSNSLEKTNIVGIAMHILDTLPEKADEKNIKEKAKVQVVNDLISNYTKG